MDGKQRNIRGSSWIDAKKIKLDRLPEDKYEIIKEEFRQSVEDNFNMN
ncbi:unnamed protein product [Chironomus riparius]|uniref:Uncharacterized protein n=1 Tax=Chironomus riparius TaxID=315576 RepID=A0A9N9RU03_9DIPT|nr:unnamed protein product [Chironomus riparius]